MYTRNFINLAALNLELSTIYTTIDLISHLSSLSAILIADNGSPYPTQLT